MLNGQESESYLKYLDQVFALIFLHGTFCAGP